MRLTVRKSQTAVKDQGDRPTCVAFAVTAFHEHVLQASLSPPQGLQTDLSEEFLHYFSKKRDQLFGRHTGTTVAAAAAALEVEGQALEVLCPYQCAGLPLVRPTLQAVEDGTTRLLSGLRKLVVSLTSVESSLRGGSALIAVMDWFATSYLAPMGRIEVPRAGDRLLGRHAVLVVELENESLTGRASMVFKNSWGTRWGNRGFGTFTEEYLNSHGRELWSLTT